MNIRATGHYYALAVLLLPTLGTQPCLAGLSFGHDWSWSSTSDNSEYIFVYLFPESIEELSQRIRARVNDPPYFTHAEEIREVVHLHSTYPYSGMYRNDGSTVPLWTTSERVYDGRPSPDGKRLVHFDTDHFFNIDVYEPGRPRRVISNLEMMGLAAFTLQIAASTGVTDLDHYRPDAKWDYVYLTWENGATSTLRLDDFAIVQSNTFRYAFFSLFTTARGIAVLVVVSTIACGLLWVLVRLLMGGRWIKLRN